MVNSSRLIHQAMRQRGDEIGASKLSLPSAYLAANSISLGFVFLRSDFGNIRSACLIYGPKG
jgi:hypothetical protein